MKTIYILIFSIIVAVGVVGLAVYAKPEQEVDLPLKVQEYSDLTCPHCRDFHETSIQLREKYADDQDVEYEFIVNPILGPTAEQAAFAAEAARNQDKFEEFIDLAYERFEERTDEDFVAFAEELELDVDQFNTDREDPELQQKVLDRVEKAREDGITSTPTVVINGKTQTDRSFDALNDKISELVELGKKQQK